MAVAKTLPELVQYCMGDDARTLFARSVLRWLMPVELGHETPSGILADWYEDQGNSGMALIVRKLGNFVK